MAANIKRLYNYRFYALLEAGRKDSARRCLVKYLETGRLPSRPGQWERLDCWQHAALARYMLSGARSSRAYLEWARSSLARLLDRHHPWQLWLSNLGRLAMVHGEGSAAREFFSLGLEICLGPDAGPTMQAMALLPLAGLDALAPGSWNPRHLHQALEAAAFLNQGHFARLLADRPGALKLVWKEPQLWFPFTYR